MKEHLKRIHTIKREPNNNNNFSKKRTSPKFVPKVSVLLVVLFCVLGKVTGTVREQ